MPSGVTRTVRLDKELDETLQQIAKNERVTVNALVNRSLRRYVDWGRHAERFNMMEVRPEILTQLMDRQSVEEARELGRRAVKDSMRPAVEYIFVDYNLENLTEFLRRFGEHSGRFSFEETIDGRKHALLLKHSLGFKWSAYYEGILEQAFGQELGIKIKITVTPEACVGRFEL